ncbi:MAG: hypothetical protein PHQ22_09920 [Sulfuricurvum sp.]|nr:hypothetical protein [Sulfuricurvum sp.]MDD5387495.1 hypothetical protein [Sulfuricurvum sp.]
MNKIKDCTYLNDIKGCEVTATYECGYFLEIEYLKNGVRKTLVIEFQPYAGSMGYGTKFCFSGVELPQTLVYDMRSASKASLEMGIKGVALEVINSLSQHRLCRRRVYMDVSCYKS